MKSSSLLPFVRLDEDGISHIHILPLIFDRSKYLQRLIDLHLFLLVDLVGLFVEDAVLEELDADEVVNWG